MFLESSVLIFILSSFVALFCHRLVTATSSWSHYMCHISNGCSIIIFLFCRLYYFLCTSLNVLWLRSKYSLMYTIYIIKVYIVHIYTYVCWCWWLWWAFFIYTIQGFYRENILLFHYVTIIMLYRLLLPLQPSYILFVRIMLQQSITLLRMMNILYCFRFNFTLFLNSCTCFVRVQLLRRTKHLVDLFACRRLR